MTLPTSKLVEYWYNQQGFFTMKGEKDEFDLLAVQNQGDNTWRYIHCELRVQSDGLFLKEQPQEKGHSSTPSFKTERWLQDTFTSFKRRASREKRVPNAEWEYHLIYGNGVHQDELDRLTAKGVVIHPLSQIMKDLKEQI
ncbi:hypothetical protein ABC345_03315 [Shouchella sp. 1P09AA]|uniref:hypothetical protein n=1 Tax=unclassified Shouchella TaxID=2893065 RepID=UPI0039A22665